MTIDDDLFEDTPLHRAAYKDASPETLLQLAALRRRYEMFGTHLAAARYARWLTQSELSAMTGITSANISRIEGGLQNPTADTLITLCDALGVTISLTFDADAGSVTHEDQRAA